MIIERSDIPANIGNEIIYKDETYTPDFILNLSPIDKFSQDDVTCIFFIPNPSSGMWKCVGVEHFKSVDNNILLSKRYNGFDPVRVFVFKGRPFDMSKLSKLMLLT